MSSVNITLNNESISVPADQTIRQVAEERGIEIPTFCFDKRLKPFASCFFSPLLSFLPGVVRVTFLSVARNAP